MHSFGSVGLKTIGNNDVAAIDSVDSNMNNGAYDAAGDAFNAKLGHQLFIAGSYFMSVNGGNNAFAGQFAYIADAAAIKFLP